MKNNYQSSSFAIKSLVVIVVFGVVMRVLRALANQIAAHHQSGHMESPKV